MFFAQCPSDNKTPGDGPSVENKAYSLPSGVIKLVTPGHALFIRKTIICGKVTFSK